MSSSALYLIRHRGHRTPTHTSYIHAVHGTPKENTQIGIISNVGGIGIASSILSTNLARLTRIQEKLEGTIPRRPGSRLCVPGYVWAAPDFENTRRPYCKPLKPLSDSKPKSCACTYVCLFAYIPVGEAVHGTRHNQLLAATWCHTAKSKFGSLHAKRTVRFTFPPRWFPRKETKKVRTTDVFITAPTFVCMSTHAFSDRLS